MIIKVMELSTAHITPHDAFLLDQRKPLMPTVIRYKYSEGYFVFVPGGVDDIKDTIHRASEEGHSEAFCAILALAREQGCKYAQIDRDGEVYDDMPTFKW